MDMDMIVDACLCLWNKCKSVFQKYQTGSQDNPKYLQKMDNPSKVGYFIISMQTFQNNSCNFNFSVNDMAQSSQILIY